MIDSFLSRFVTLWRHPPQRRHPVPAGSRGVLRAVADSDGRPVVCHVVLNLKVGGLERLVCSLATSFAGEARTIVLCLDERGELAADVERAGGEVVVLRRRRGTDWLLPFRLARFLRRRGVTATHTHSLDPMWYTAAAALLARVPVRVHTQHLNLGGAPYTRRHRLKFRIAAAGQTSIASITPEIDASVAACGVPSRRRTVVLNGIDTDACAAAAARGERGGSVIGTAARLTHQKGIDCLLRAFAAVRAAEPRARLRIIGDGPLRGELEALAAALGVSDATEFAGFRSDVPGELASLDVFVLPSRFEGLPLALLEAMASGLPVVASAVNAIPQAVDDGRCGMLVAPGDVDGLSRSILALLAEPALRRQLGALAAERVSSHYSLRAMVCGYRAIYFRFDEPSRRSTLLRACLDLLTPNELLFWKGRRADRVALTFDDGPDRTYTPRILEILRRHRVRATFFVIGDRAAANPDLVAAMVRDGHEVANHSYTHCSFRGLSADDALDEILRAEAVIEGVAGRRSRFFRPPRGVINPSALLSAWRSRLTVAMWSVDLKDFRARDVLDITLRLARRPIRGGDVILYHGQTPAALEALPSVVKAAAREGRRVVPLSELHAS
jgi:glycosyltransferase involved in cell wall biosynthesis/peptidoglycan/xylan/chitin deacetylase (PgdA/CDA1 family)